MNTYAPGSQRNDLDRIPVPHAAVHVFVWAAMAVLVLTLIALSQAGRGRKLWAGWRESPELRRPVYTERIRADDVFRTRANTWSNLAYVLVGLYAIGFGWHDRRRKFAAEDGYVRYTPAMSFLFGVACCYLGVGSGLFHASLTRWAQQLDVAAMYAPLVALIAMSMGRWRPVIRPGSKGLAIATWPILTALALVTWFLLYRYKWSMSSRVVLPVLIVAVGGCALLDQLQARRRLSVHWLGLAGAMLVLGVICRQLDVAGRFSGPDSWLQGHLFWHIFTSASLGCMYLYHRSEIS
jgi:hypothetical protein